MSNLTHIGAQYFCEKAKKFSVNLEDASGLIVGYGKGHESAFLGQELQIILTAIDIIVPEIRDEMFSPAIASVLELPFPDNHFDFVFYHHVIEHVPDPYESLVEIRRILKPGGFVFIGTPNRHRLAGYIGSHNTPLHKKVTWNLADYKARLLGRFRNELGAHAGFSERELTRMLISAGMTNLNWLTKDYLKFKYEQRLPKPIMQFIFLPTIKEIAAPSIYVLCEKGA